MGRFPMKTFVGGSKKPLAIRLKEGTRVDVMLPRDGRWFNGAVMKYDTKKALHTIINDVGETKRVDLRTVQWKLEGIEECTDADLENALDRGKRWHKAQRAEFLDSMKCPMLSPRDSYTRKNGEAQEGGAWDTNRLRVRREPRDWSSSSDGDSGCNGEVLSGDEEDEFMDEAGTCADSAHDEPPRLLDISRQIREGHVRPFHLDFQLPSSLPVPIKAECEDDGAKFFGDKLGRQLGRKKSFGPDPTILKRPVGRPPKVRKGLAAIKYAQDVASRAINRMARDKLCNFSVIPSSIPFVEELQLIFGISRRLKVEKQRLCGREDTELAAQVLTGCRMAQESAERGTDAAEPKERKLSAPPHQHAELEKHSSPAACSTAVSSAVSPLKPPMCPSVLRDDWSRGFQSSLVV